MPVTSKQDLPGPLQRSPEKAQRTFAEALESAEKTYKGDSERAYRTAYAALKHSFKKVGDHWEPKRRRGPSDPQARKGTPQSRSRGKTYGGVDAESQTKEELLEDARRLEVKGRSKMNKRELADAIAKASRRQDARRRRKR
jgi:hypothetical protein